MSLGERPRGSARPTPNEHYNSLPRTSIEGALANRQGLQLRLLRSQIGQTSAPGHWGHKSP